MRKILLCLLVCLTAATGKAQTVVEVNGIKYITQNGKALLGQIADSIATGDLVIPETVEGCQVVAVGGVYYYNNGRTRIYYPLAGKNFTSVTFPSTIVNESVTIGAWSARYGMEYAEVRGNKNLKRVDIPEHVTKLPGSMYKACPALESIELPPALKTFASPDFSGCDSLKSVKWAKEASYVDGFTNCKMLEQVLIPEGVTSISADAFYGCEKLDITLPESIERIGERAFSYCHSLKLDHLPAALTQLGREAFYQCPLITVSSIPEGVKSIFDAFVDCDNITSMHLHKDVKEAKGLGGKGLATITVDAANPYMKTIDGVLFNSAADSLLCCPGARTGSYTVPETTRFIPQAAFANSQLNDVTLPDGVTSLDANVFIHSAIKEVSLPGNAVLYKNGQEVAVFNAADSIERISVRTGESIYYDIDGVLCKQENGHEALVFYPFNHPNTEYTLPAQIDSITYPISANKLKKFTWGEGLKRIYYACLLHNCKQLETLVLPNTIEDINGNLCLECPALRNVVSFMEKEEQFKSMGNRWFQFTGVDKTQCTVYCPDGLVEMYKNSGVWQVFGTSDDGPLTIRPMSEYLQTGINETTAQNRAQDGNAWYTLDGRRIEKPAQPGLYIHNGRKMVVK